MSGFRGKNAAAKNKVTPKAAPAQEVDEVEEQEEQLEEGAEEVVEEGAESEEAADEASEDKDQDGPAAAPVAAAPVAPAGPKKNPNVRIKPNQDINSYIGDQWYRLKKGVETNVPLNVKEILNGAGALDPL